MFSKQEGESTYSKIKTIYKLAAENIALVKTTWGGGQYGYLANILDSNTYYILIGQTFIAPTNPGLVSIIARITYTAAIAAQENT